MVGTVVFAIGVAFTMPALLELAVSQRAARRARLGRRHGDGVPRHRVRVRAGRARSGRRRDRATASTFLVSAVLRRRRQPARSSSARPARAADPGRERVGSRRWQSSGVRRRRRAHGPRHRPGLSPRRVSDVVLYEPELARAVAGRDRIAGNLERAVSEGPARRGGPGCDCSGASEPPTTRPTAAGAGLVVEAIFEDLDVKRAFWSRARRPRSGRRDLRLEHELDLDRRARRGRRGGSPRPAFVGMHFFSPVPVMPLIELVRGTATTGRDGGDGARRCPRTSASASSCRPTGPGSSSTGCSCRSSPRRCGPSRRASGRAEDIDAGAKVGLNHPMGPLALADFIGLDVCKGIMDVLYEGFGGERFRPPRVLSIWSRPGHLGQKTGRGFHAVREERLGLSPPGCRRTDEPSRPFDRPGRGRTACASRTTPRAAASSLELGSAMLPLMNAKRRGELRRLARGRRRGTPIPVMPAIRWSHRIASGGASDRTISSASAPSAATIGS